MLMSNGLASSVTEASPDARRARIARRVGSARAEKVWLNRSSIILTVWLNNSLVKYSATVGSCQYPPEGFLDGGSGSDQLHWEPLARSMNCVILQPSYIPWRGYFHQIQKADLFIFYDDVNFDKDGWRNRNRIKTAQGTKWLTIPVT